MDDKTKHKILSSFPSETDAWIPDNYLCNDEVTHEMVDDLLRGGLIDGRKTTQEIRPNYFAEHDVDRLSHQGSEWIRNYHDRIHAERDRQQNEAHRQQSKKRDYWMLGMTLVILLATMALLVKAFW
jgi:hypothetical protein